MPSYDGKDFNHHGVSFIGVIPVILLLLSAAELTAGQVGRPDPRNDNTYNNYRQVSPALAVVVVVLVAALFFIGFFSIYFRRCNGGSHADASALPAGGTRRNANSAARGLDASIIETFPTFVYSEVKTLKIGKGVLECAVCLNEFEDHETLRLLPKCDHVFHPHCIGAWLEAHVTCPVCRANLAEQPVQTDLVEPEGSERDLEAQQVLPEPANVEPVPEQAPQELQSRMDGPRVSKFPRSHTTGHSLVQPGGNTERFTLRLPDDVRKQIVENWKLNRANSLVLPRGGSSRRGKTVDRSRVRSERLFLKTPSFLWRNSSVQSPKLSASGRRKGGSIKLGGRNNGIPSSTSNSVQSDRWSFLRNPSFLWRNSSVHSPKMGANNDGEGTSAHPIGTVGSTSNSVRLPV